MENNVKEGENEERVFILCCVNDVFDLAYWDSLERKEKVVKEN